VSEHPPQRSCESNGCPASGTTTGDVTTGLVRPSSGVARGSACGDGPQAGSRWADRTSLAKGSNIGRGTAKECHETGELVTVDLSGPTSIMPSCSLPGGPGAHLHSGASNHGASPASPASWNEPPSPAGTWPLTYVWVASKWTRTPTIDGSRLWSSLQNFVSSGAGRAPADLIAGMKPAGLARYLP
jgi:hypothetical protein